MNFKIIGFGVFILTCIMLTSCQNNDVPIDSTNDKEKKIKVASQNGSVPEKKIYAPLPDNIAWLTNDTDPVFLRIKLKKAEFFTRPSQVFP